MSATVALLPVTDRMLPNSSDQELVDLAAHIADRELAPQVDEAEERGYFPAAAYRVLGEAGLLSLPYPEELGGGGQPYEVYLAVLEEIAARWLSVGIGVSVHTLACFPVAQYGTAQQQQRWLPDFLSGRLLGAYALSEPHCGSDAAALRTRGVLVGERYQVTGTKSWITHAGVADFYNLMVRTGGSGPSGISCLLAAADTPGLQVGPAERKIAAMSSPTAQLHLDGALVPAEQLIGGQGEGFRIAMAALDAGRLGIAACAIGLARAALSQAVAYAGAREAFGQPIGAFQGVGFMLADMDTQIAAARALLVTAARLRDAGKQFSVPAARAKLLATDAAMSITTDAVQVLGGAGCTRDFPVERYLREAKILQVVEGTNQIQRVVISRALLRQ